MKAVLSRRLWRTQADELDGVQPRGDREIRRLVQAIGGAGRQWPCRPTCAIDQDLRCDWAWVWYLSRWAAMKERL